MTGIETSKPAIAHFVLALFLSFVFSPAVQVAHALADEGGRPLVTSVEVTPKKLTKNRINLVTVTFGFKDKQKDLSGGLLNINLLAHNGKNRFWTMDLTDPVFSKAKGTFSFQLSIKPENEDYYGIYIWLRDGSGNNGNDPEIVRLDVRNKAPKKKQGYNTGDTAYNFSLRDQSGKLGKLTNYKGKVVLLDFCAMWCAPCKKEAAELEALYQDYKDQGLVILTVVSENYKSQTPTQEECKAWADLYGLTTPVLTDTLFGVYESYTQNLRITRKVIPYNVIIDRDGVIRWKNYGYTEERHKQMETMIKKLLEE